MVAMADGDIETMTRAESVEARLREAFSPTSLAVTDESHLHAGHAGWREGGGTHIRVAIVSDAFAGQTRLARHRAVNAALTAELEDGLHALAIEARAPDEPGRRAP